MIIKRKNKVKVNQKFAFLVLLEAEASILRSEVSILKAEFSILKTESTIL